MDEFFCRYKKLILESVSHKNKEIMTYYVSFINLGLKAVKSDKVTPEIKVKKFDLLYRQIFKRCAIKDNIISKLQESFITDNISLSLLSDMVKSFKDLVLGEQYKSWNRFVYSSQLFLSPLVRIIIVLNDLNMSVYIPFMSMMMCFLLVENYDVNKIEELQNLSGTKYSNLYAEKLSGFLREGQVLPQIVKNKIFRFKALCMLGILNVMFEKKSKKERMILSNIDLGKILLYDSVRWLFTRVKTIKIKGV